MTSNVLLTGVLLGSSAWACAQTTPQSATASGITADQPARYAAAHDSLMRRVEAVRSEAESRMGFFKSSEGSLGSAHRRVQAYAKAKGVSSFYSGVSTPAGAGVVKTQTIKRRFGVELDKVVFYDAKGRKTLIERHENHVLTRLELLDYAQDLNLPNSRWLFVRGDYLMHMAQPTLALSTKKTFYYFRALPSAD
ncbi:hypothetical protein MUN81_00940 [Hymenobacter sp. 5317J-9]|uniref:hypothetical protein n=1 Tax=Hymenobacter sp. 5317J-9 TaxID=2932250 RepID=UPI001FD6AA2F|nr:hypothetical protein [Hymenobacter sp. 5317J-9]UOQ98072.1 hypothetical protein MUN81_00940 [Hymenobacter sp. 5317J-9]